MEKTILKLRQIGDIEAKKPSLGICFEFVTLWSSAEGDPALLSRVCSGAIGCVIDHAAKLPKYRPALMTPSEYGHICLNRLLEYGAGSTTIFREGSKALSIMATAIPNDENITEEADFLDSKQEENM